MSIVSIKDGENNAADEMLLCCDQSDLENKLIEQFQEKTTSQCIIVFCIKLVIKN